MVEQAKTESKKVNAWDKYMGKGATEVIYWSRAKKLRIGNFRMEEHFPSGKIKSRELPLPFDEHIHICDLNSAKGQEEIEFIEASDTFKNGDCRYVKNHAEAVALTAQQGAIKGIRSVTVSSTESVELKDAGEAGYTPIPGTAKSSDTVTAK